MPETSRNLLLGIDVGGTKTALVVGTLEGQVLERVVFESNAKRGYQPILDDILGNAENLIAAFPQIVAVGASLGGPLDSEAGLVLSPPHLPGWDAVPFAEHLSALGKPVAIEHDAKAGALAEWRYGAGRGCSDLVFLTLGTGIGAGIIAGGRILRGAKNASGEIGHWRMRSDGPHFHGKSGSLEGFTSGAGLAEFARTLFPETLSDVQSAKDLGERAHAGDADALEAIAQSGEILGEALAQIVDLLAPQKIILGGLSQRLGRMFSDPLRRAISREALASTLENCQIVNGELEDRIGDLAALSVAMGAHEKSNN